MKHGITRTMGMGLLLAAPFLAQGTKQATDRPHRPLEGCEDLRFDPEKLEVGRVFQYRHSNIDGTRASRVSLYWAKGDTLEALKWNPDHSGATLVEARMSWESFSVVAFRTFDIAPDGKRRLKASLETIGNELVIGGGLRREIEAVPWHSYDFDLASLNVSLRFMLDPEETLVFYRADGVRGPSGFDFAFIGGVELIYVEDEVREEIPCRKYAIDGPGLEDRGGFLWASRNELPCIVDFEIDLPDEPGMSSGKLTLLETGMLTGEEWAAFVAARVR